MNSTSKTTTNSRISAVKALDTKSQKKTNSSTSSPSVSLRSLSYPHIERPPAYLNESKIGIISNVPELCEDGTGGTYFLKNKNNKPVSVFKPKNEDPLSLQNPKRTQNNTNFHFKGIQAGEGVLREVFSSQIDKNNFAGIPETHLTEISHWIFTDENGVPGSNTSNIKTKIGSLQEFVSDIQCTVDDMGYGKFSLEDVQKIAILDLLLLNCDRNGGNILVKKNSFKLVPIDHAFSLPDYQHLSDLQWFEWITWRQVKQNVIPSVKSFINDFDINDAIKKARNLGIREDCITSLQLSYTFLLSALKTNLTLYEIAKKMIHQNKTSEFESLVSKALERSNGSEESLLQSFNKIVSNHFQKQ